MRSCIFSPWQYTVTKSEGSLHHIYLACVKRQMNVAEFCLLFQFISTAVNVLPQMHYFRGDGCVVCHRDPTPADVTLNQICKFCVLAVSTTDVAFLVEYNSVWDMTCIFHRDGDGKITSVV